MGAVLGQLLGNDLFVKAEKCEFHSPSVLFLGFIVAQGEIRMDPSKISVVRDWPHPESRKQLQQFLLQPVHPALQLSGCTPHVPHQHSVGLQVVTRGRGGLLWS